MPKNCANCKQQFDESNFYKRKDGRLQSWCKICNRKSAKDYYAKHPGLVGERAKTWRETNPDRIKEYRAANRQKSHRQEIARKYGVSVGWFDVQMSKQNGKCMGCKCELLWTNKQDTPHVDHCHKSGKVRGILCNRCNSVVGLCEDSTTLLQSLIRYLKCHGSSAND